MSQSVQYYVLLEWGVGGDTKGSVTDQMLRNIWPGEWGLQMSTAGMVGGVPSAGWWNMAVQLVKGGQVQSVG